MHRVSTLLLLQLLFCNSLFALKYDAEVVNYTSTSEVSGSELIKSYSVTIQINNRIGDKYAKFKIPYSKDVRLNELKAWIESPDGTVIRKLKKGDVTERSAFTDYLYVDMYIKEFMLMHNVYPYRVVCNYTTVSENFMSIADWTPVYYSDIPTTNASLIVKVPVGYEYKKYTLGINDSEKSTLEKQQVLKFISTYTEPVKEEIYSLIHVGSLG
jgi:hypothetical protein